MRTGWSEVEFNGRRQWVSVRGAPRAPVLLFVHGGPGGAEFAPRRRYLRDLERDWLVIDWDQPGAGRSYRGDETSTSLSLESLTADGVALVALLADDFGDRPLVLAAHSFGTVLGVRIAERAQQHIHAYVGASQVVNWALQEARSYNWALEEARRAGHRKAEAALERIGRPIQGQYASGTDGVQIQRRWLGTLGGVAVNPRFVPVWALSIFTSRDYPLTTKLHYMRAMARSMDILWPRLCEEIDLARDTTTLEVPVHIFAGRQDRITDLAQIEDWFAALEAPAKHLEIVDEAAHLNLYEAPGRFITFMDNVRAGLP
ncbi:MAG: alpha/beta hydrolase [Candidatus Nanopelagicales bacterium]